VCILNLVPSHIVIVPHKSTDPRLKIKLTCSICPSWNMDDTTLFLLQVTLNANSLPPLTSFGKLGFISIPLQFSTIYSLDSRVFGILHLGILLDITYCIIVLIFNQLGLNILHILRFFSYHLHFNKNFFII